MQSTHTATKSRKLTNCQLYDIVKENFFSSFYTTYIFIKYTIAFKNGKSIIQFKWYARYKKGN